MSKEDSYAQLIELVGLTEDPLIKSDQNILLLQESVTELYRKTSGMSRSEMAKCGFDMTIGRRAGHFLYHLVRSLKPRIVVETGVARGVSTAYILAAMHSNGLGVLHSVDIVKDCGALVRDSLRSRWRFHHGPSNRILYQLDLGDIDIFLHDSQHSYSNMRDEYRWAYPNLRLGGILLSDDIDMNDAFQDFSKLVKEEMYFVKTSDKAYRFGAIIKTRESHFVDLTKWFAGGQL